MTIAYSFLIVRTVCLWVPSSFSGTKTTGTDQALSILLNIFHPPEMAGLPQTDVGLAAGPALLPEPRRSKAGMPVQ